MLYLLAYVDPGLVGVFYQWIYAILFGGAVLWILRPWRWLRSRGRSEPTSGAPEAPEAHDEGGASVG